MDKSSTQSAAEVAKDTQKWSMRKLVDYWRRLDERQNKYDREKGNALDSVFQSESSPEKGHTWSDGNINSLDLKALSNLMSTKESYLPTERPQFLSLTSMHEGNLLRHQIAKAAATTTSGADESTSQDKGKTDLTNHEENEATVTLQSIAIAREQRPALADLDWSQGNERQATPPRAIRPDNHQEATVVPAATASGGFGSLQSDFSGLSSVTGGTSCYYTSLMTASELQNEETFSLNNDGDDTGESGSSASCSSDSSDDENNRPSFAKPSDLKFLEDNALNFSGQTVEDEGRRYMMEELGLSGDDQTIVVVSYHCFPK